MLLNLDGTNGPTIQYLLGDIFHSNPVVIGGPVNVLFFGDLYSDGTECTDDETGNPGYRCYFARHRFRRKVLWPAPTTACCTPSRPAASARAGPTPPPVAPPEQFDNGTGHELFAFMPRSTLPTVKTQAQGRRTSTASMGARSPPTSSWMPPTTEHPTPTIAAGARS